jgi:hypothetical protein
MDQVLEARVLLVNETRVSCTWVIDKVGERTTFSTHPCILRKEEYK